MRKITYQKIIKKSFIESFIDIGSGFLLAILTQIIIFPFFNYEVTITNSISLACIFTCISLIRSWCWRIYFSYKATYLKTKQ